MKTKNKITLSIGLLMTIIVLFGYYVVSSTRQMKTNTENILKDNYNSIRFAQKMQSSVNLFHLDSTSAKRLFEENLALQQRNVTEAQERRINNQLALEYQAFLDAPTPLNMIHLNRTINDITRLNTDAIYTKSAAAVDEAHRSFIVIFLLAVVSALIAVVMLVRLPKVLITPINKLKEGILEIANHNYDKRLEFDLQSEFGTVAASFNNMAQELARFQKSSMARIISTKQYLETVINAIEEPIIGIDNGMKILFANNALSSILNLPKERLTQQSALDLALSNDLLRRLLRGLEQSREGNEETPPLKIYADNKESYYQVHYLRLPETSGTVIMLSDVTKFKVLDNAKTNFISVISHELKTPIAAIMMSLKLLEDKRIGDINEEQSALTQSIRDNSDRLLSISSELLKMTQVETGVLQLSPKVTKPIELIDYAINATRVLAERFHCNIEVEYPAEKMPKLFVDSEKIAWVVTNLLSNAIHYSAENSRIIIGASHTDNRVDIFVRDFGRGIDPRYHKTIFDRYFRVPGTKVQGSGLGLAISKDFVEAHGGTIGVESEIGKGSLFTISFTIA